MADIFNRVTDAFGGAFPADQAKVTFPALINNQGAQAGLIMQNMTVNYQQQISRVFEIGTPFHYLVAGRASGQAAISKISGPRKIAKEFYQTYGDVCRARTNALHFAVTTGCDGDQTELARASFTCHFVVITGVGFNLRAEDMLINESIAMMFSSFIYDS